MEEAPRIEGVVSAKKISTKDAAKLTKRFLLDFSTYLHEDEDAQTSEELSNDIAPEVEAVHIHIHDQLVNFVEFHLGSSTGLKRIVEVPRPQAVIEGGIDSVTKGEQGGGNPFKSENKGAGDGSAGNKNLTPKEMRKLEKAKAKELKKQEKAKEKELKRQEKEQKKLAKKERKEKRRRSKSGNGGEDEPATKKVKSEDYM